MIYAQGIDSEMGLEAGVVASAVAAVGLVATAFVEVVAAFVAAWAVVAPGW